MRAKSSRSSAAEIDRHAMISAPAAAQAVDRRGPLSLLGILLQNDKVFKKDVSGESRSLGHKFLSGQVTHCLAINLKTYLEM